MRDMNTPPQGFGHQHSDHSVFWDLMQVHGFSSLRAHDKAHSYGSYVGPRGQSNIDFVKGSNDADRLLFPRSFWATKGR